MDEIKIEKGIPIPERSKYPFAEMKPGDSIFIPGKKANQLSLATHTQKLRAKGWRFCSRTVDDGARVWRIE